MYGAPVNLKLIAADPNLVRSFWSARTHERLRRRRAASQPGNSTANRDSEARRTSGCVALLIARGLLVRRALVADVGGRWAERCALGDPRRTPPDAGHDGHDGQHGTGTDQRSAATGRWKPRKNGAGYGRQWQRRSLLTRRSIGAGW